jgi:hypothetical protein
MKLIIILTNGVTKSPATMPGGGALAASGGWDLSSERFNAARYSIVFLCSQPIMPPHHFQNQ